MLWVRTLAGRGAAFTGGLIALSAIAIALLVWQALSWRRNLSGHLAGRLCLFGATLVTAGVTIPRLPEMLRGEFAWPPQERDLSTGLPWLTATEQAQWTVRLMAHAATVSGFNADAEPSWPLPAGVRVRRDSLADTLALTAVSSNGRTKCVARLFHGALIVDGGHADDVATCGVNDGKGDLHLPIRRPPARAAVPVDSVSAWPQYRRSAAKVAVDGDTLPGRAFRWHVGGEIRSSVAIVGRTAVVGSHGTGTLTAISLDSGRANWTVTVPNWIHEDPVAARGIVVVGFGDNDRSFWARSPAGVAAYRAIDGVHLWTAFESNSVMSSPVIFGSHVLYATTGGVLISRNIADGHEVTRAHLPGSVQMAPPALVGTTLITSVGRSSLCANDVETLKERWCRKFSGLLNTDAAAPAIFDSIVVQSGTQPPSLARLTQQWLATGLPLFASILLDVAAGRSNRSASQSLVAVSLESGKTLWQQPPRAARRALSGHTSGTAVGSSHTAVVVLPVPDIVVAFDATTGRNLWERDAEGARGPVLTADSSVFVFSSTGSIRVLDLRTGRLRCRYASSLKFDRAGPVLAGSLLIEGSISGDVLALPRREIETCNPIEISGLRVSPSS